MREGHEVSGRGVSFTWAAVSVVVVVSVVAGAASASAGRGAASGSVRTVLRPRTFVYTGAQQRYVVPAGINSVHVEAIGGEGGAGNDGSLGPFPPGGFGAMVSADVPVAPGSILYVEVGGNGVEGGLNAAGNGGAGGFNGGGGAFDAGSAAGGGGGASDVRTCSMLAAHCRWASDTLDSRVLVAGGGGGGGQPGGVFGGAGGAGAQPGDAGACGAMSGGGAGTSSGGGTGGVASCGSGSGLVGVFGVGGRGGMRSLGGGGGGGGGGGWYGGGGAAGSTGFAGGGGGGSNFTASYTSNSLFANGATGIPKVVITPEKHRRAAATIGRTASSTVTCAAFTGPATTFADTSYVVPLTSGGKITSFSYYSRPAELGQQVDFLVLRPVGSNNYNVVGKTGLVTLAGTGRQSFHVSIQAHGGDVLGIWAPISTDNCLLSTTGAMKTELFGAPDPSTGGTVGPLVGSVPNPFPPPDTVFFNQDLNESASLTW